MKKIISLTLAFLFLVHFSNAQTTMQDYLYVKNGLKSDLDMGKGPKPGYSKVDLDISERVSWNNGQWRGIKLHSFNKGSVRKAIIVEFIDKDRNQSFKCIPSPYSDQSVLDLAYSDFNGLPSEWNLVLARAFLEVVSKKLF